MLDHLEAATRAYREAQNAVGEAEDALVEAKAAVPVARAKLAEAIVEAARAGAKQRDIVAITGYNRERIRTIVRAAGIEAE